MPGIEQSANRKEAINTISRGGRNLRFMCSPMRL